MKAKLIIRQVITVEIDGTPVQGDFIVEDSWEGLIKLGCSGPVQTFIIQRPELNGANVYDLLPKFLGGNRPGEAPLTLDVNIVLPAKRQTKEL